MTQSQHTARRWFGIAIAFVLFATLGARVLQTGSGDVTTIILVRHAEKIDQSRDPSLSEAGEARARTLAHMVESVGIEGAFVTQFKRTAETLQPMAQALGVEVEVFEATRDLDAYSREFAEMVLRDYAGRTVITAGHSNTVPLLIAAFGVEVMPVIEDGEYDDLFVVTVDGEGRATLLHLKYGAPT